jgi:excisionase family DNA binding protein
MATILKPNAFYSTSQIAELLQMKQRTIQRWIDDGQLKAYRFGRKYRVRGQDFDEFMELFKAHTPTPKRTPGPVDADELAYIELDDAQAKGREHNPTLPNN